MLSDTDYEYIAYKLVQGYVLQLINPNICILSLKYENYKFVVEKVNDFRKTGVGVYHSLRNGTAQTPDVESYCQIWQEMLRAKGTSILFIRVE